MQVVVIMIFVSGLMMLYMICDHIKARFDLIQAELARCAKLASELKGKIDSAAVERAQRASDALYDMVSYQGAI